jgi:hypothetical protein
MKQKGEGNVSSIRVGGFTALVVTTCTAIAATGASAAGPLWLTAAKGLLNSEAATASATADNGAFKLKTVMITIECTSLHSPMTLIGGMPAKNSWTIYFTGCSVAGKTETECHVNSPGEPVGSLTTSANAEVVYIGNHKEAEKEEGKLGERFTPATGDTLLEVVVNGTKCPMFTKGEQELKGSMIGEISPVATMATSGELSFPAPLVAKGYRWVGKGNVVEVTASLSMFGIIKAEQTGGAEICLDTGRAFGVTRS